MRATVTLLAGILVFATLGPLLMGGCSGDPGPAENAPPPGVGPIEDRLPAWVGDPPPEVPDTLAAIATVTWQEGDPEPAVREAREVVKTELLDRIGPLLEQALAADGIATLVENAFPEEAVGVWAPEARATVLQATLEVLESDITIVRNEAEDGPGFFWSATLGRLPLAAAAEATARAVVAWIEAQAPEATLPSRAEVADALHEALVAEAE